jgi:mRNA-degrading endonuclease RelE of RelBE toxin-antitoxin system
MTDVLIAPRLQRKLALLEGRLADQIDRKLERIGHMSIEALFRESHIISETSDRGRLWVIRIASEYRLVYRIVKPGTIEVLDFLSQADLKKFRGVAL